jgi:hypothetical protein
MTSRRGNKRAHPPLSFSKYDARYWLARVFKPKSIRLDWICGTSLHYARFQFRGRRVSISLGTADRAEAARRTKEGFLFLVVNGWQKFEATYPSSHIKSTMPKSMFSQRLEE